MLQPGAVFEDLRRVPTVTGDLTDLSRYPNRRGFEDIAMLCADPTLENAWTAVVFPAEGYLWFSLRDPKVLASTVLWMSNGGRYYPPWNGRHINVMGIEDVTAYFALGLAASVKPNPLNRRGIRTYHTLNNRRPFIVRHIMGVAAIPNGFESVRQLKCGPDSVTLIGARRQKITVPLNPDFLRNGRDELA